jgi:hypothetical protein
LSVALLSRVGKAHAVTHVDDDLLGVSLADREPLSADAMALGAEPRKRTVLIICTHMRRDRSKGIDRDFLQPLAGVHIGSCISHDIYDVTLYHEMWHGPYDPAAALPGRYALVFLTGLQQEFDRMRQLSYFFRQAGSKVVAGGSICTLFPEFAARFFDVVCVGGVEAVFDVMRDYASGDLRSVYRASRLMAGNFSVAYHLLAKSGIDLPFHLIEASRGCSFACSFCTLPAEKSRFAAYGTSALLAAIDHSIAASPRWSLRRWWPMIWFMDNNFSDDAENLRKICNLLSSHRKIRGWGALITQNVLRDRDMITLMARSKCRALFVGIESFDREFLKAMRKKQNLSRTQSVAEDVMFAERQGIVIVYSQLIDPRSAVSDKARADLVAIARDGRLPLPAFIGFVSPLVGTHMFWECIHRNELRPGLRMRELDGETIAFRKTKEPLERAVELGRAVSTETWRIVPRYLVLWNVLRRMVRAHRLDPWGWFLAIRSSWRIMAKAGSYSTARPRNYLGGEDLLDPQYFEYPADVSQADIERYFQPILLTESDGRVADWLLPYYKHVPSNSTYPATGSS